MIFFFCGVEFFYVGKNDVWFLYIYILVYYYYNVFIYYFRKRMFKWIILVIILYGI